MVLLILEKRFDFIVSHPNEQFVRLPPPPDELPYVTRFLLTAGAKATRNATLVTNYPLNG